MFSLLPLIGRQNPLFEKDLSQHEAELARLVENNRFLVIGGAGSIGQAVTKEIFARGPRVLHVVDISENNMVELVRDIRSSLGYIDGEFRTFALDCGSPQFEAMVRAKGPYDYVLNLSALKHVRSERDPYTLMRMVEVNILNTISTLELAVQSGARKYFCVSTDKAANPVNMMGASKRIMEMFLIEHGRRIPISTARFANVAFSDGSLLHGFNQRLLKSHPISAPRDVRRYFLTPKEAGELCLMSTVLGQDRDIFFPKLSEELYLQTFSDIAEKYLRQRDYEPFLCESEDEARARVDELRVRMHWPCFFFDSDTTGEKAFEEFCTEDEAVDWDRFATLGVAKNSTTHDPSKLKAFVEGIHRRLESGSWTKKDLLDLFFLLLPDFSHNETGKYLDDRM